MEVFYLTLSQMITMFILILSGYALRKYHILPEESHLTLSRLETYILVPALNIVNWSKNCNPESLSENAVLILYGLGVIILALLIAYPLAALFVRNAKTPAEKYQRNIYKYAMTFGNYGFMGNFIVLGIWGDEMFFKYSMFTLFISFVCSSWGLIILIPKESGTRVSFKNMVRSIFTPPVVALFIGMIIGVLNLGAYVPSFVNTALSNAGNCMGPVAMILAGFVIGGFNLKSLIINKKVYIATVFRLILIPALFVLLLKLIGANDTVLTLTLICLATPFGMNTIVYPAAYGGDFRTGASMTMISSTLSVITIPLMYLIFIVLM